MFVKDVEGLEVSVNKEPVAIHVRVSAAHVVRILPHVSPKLTLKAFTKAVMGFEILMIAISTESYRVSRNLHGVVIISVTSEIIDHLLRLFGHFSFNGIQILQSERYSTIKRC